MSFEGLDGVSVIVDIGECNCEDSREKTQVKEVDFFEKT